MTVSARFRIRGPSRPAHIRVIADAQPAHLPGANRCNAVLPRHMIFEWDEDKNAANREKQGIAFEDLVAIFALAHSEGLIAQDRRKNYREDRFILLCPFNGRIYHVVFTWREDRIRLISARRANRKEVQDYERRKHH